MDKDKPGLKQRLQYTFDNLFSRGPWMLIAALAVFTLLVSILSGLLLASSGLTPGGEQPSNFTEALWRSLLANLGEGSIGGRESVWGYRFLMLALTLTSIFIVSNLIGIITSAIQTKIDNLRQGRSRVIEHGHTIILGWSEQIFTIVPQLVLAYGGRPGRIVILGDEDKVVMEDQLRLRVGKTGPVRIICRRGKPIEMADLSLTNFNQSSGIIILSPESPNPDAEVVKTVLAITKHPERRTKPFQIVAGLHEPSNRDLGRVVGDGEVEWITIDDVIARIIAQTCRQPGLSVAYSELLDFTGDEIYFHEDAALIGKTYREALSAYDQGAVIGVQTRGGQARLNPAMASALRPGDRLVVVADGENQLTPAVRGLTREEAILPAARVSLPRENTLVLGWNTHAGNILRELDHYSQPGAKVCVVSQRPELKREVEKAAAGLSSLRLTFQSGSISERATLERLKPHKYDHVILLSNDSELSVQQADSNTLITLLYVRDIANQLNLPYSVVTEILDARNSRLAEVARADDFIVSDRLISLMMAQVVVDQRRNAVYNDLFSPEGSEIYIRPAGQYVKTGQAVNFYTLVESAARRGETAIGYRMMALAEDPRRAYGVVLNPKKSDEIVFTERDKVIVLAEND